MDDKKIEELKEQKKVSKFKKLLLMLGLSTSLTAATVGCSTDKVDNEVKIESNIDDTEEETVVEGTPEVVEGTPEVVEETKEETVVEVTPAEEVVEEIAITPVTVEQAEEYIASLTAEYPNEKPEVIRGMIALYNKPYFENENDYLTVMGVESTSDIDSEYLKECVDYMRNTAGKSTLVYKSGYAEDQLGEPFESSSYYEDAIKYSQVIIPKELSKLTTLIDGNVSVLVQFETGSKESIVSADNIAALLFDKKFGTETETVDYSILNGETPQNVMLEYSLMAVFSDLASFSVVSNPYFENYDRMDEVSDYSYVEENLFSGITK